MRIKLKEERHTIQVGDLVQFDGMANSGIRMVITTQDGKYALLDLETATETCVGESIEHLVKINSLVLYARNEDLILTKR